MVNLSEGGGYTPAPPAVPMMAFAKREAALVKQQKKMQDQLVEGSCIASFSEFIDDLVTFPAAILKGPVVRRRKRMEWGPNFTPIVMTDFAREFSRVSPYDAYPSPNSCGPNDGWFIQRHRLSRGELSSMKGTPGYNDENIDQVLTRFGETGFRNWLMGDQERDNLEGKPHSRLYNDERFVTEFAGRLAKAIKSAEFK